MSTTFEILKKNIHAYHSTYTKGEMQKIADEIDEANRAGGIASYYTSPLALRDEYKKESGGMEVIEFIKREEIGDAKYSSHYGTWLENKLCRRKAGE